MHPQRGVLNCRTTLEMPREQCPPEIGLSRLTAYYEAIKKALFKAENYRVSLYANVQSQSMDIANNGQEGLDMLQKESYDMVLMDLQMPVMDGFEAIETTRAGKAGNRNTGIPIIAVTADITPKTRSQVLQLGADDDTTKPVDEAVLREKMDALLRASSAA